MASTIVGARTVEQLDEIFAALEVKLSRDVLKECDEIHQQYLYPMG